MPEGEPTQNNQIEYVLTGPKGYWGARARAAGLSATSANKTKRRSRSRGRRENVYYRPVPDAAKVVRFRNPAGIRNNVERALEKGVLQLAPNYKNTYNGKTMNAIQTMPRPARKEFETHMSIPTYIKYASDAGDFKVDGYAMKGVVMMPWPYLRNYMNRLDGVSQRKILNFMEVVYREICRRKAQEVVAGHRLADLAKLSDDEMEEVLHTLSGKNSEDVLAALYGNFGGMTLNELVYSIETGDNGSTLENREAVYMNFLASLPPKEMYEASFLVNIYLIYDAMRGRKISGYSDGRWVAP